MTTPINNIIRGGAQGRSLFPSALPLLDDTVNYNQGDLLCLDTSNHVLVPAATGNVANFLGVAVNTIVDGKPKSPYPGVPVNEASSDLAGPLYSVVATFTLETGSALDPGDLVYLSSLGAQTVADSDPGVNGSIGIYTGSQGTFSSSPAGQKIDVLIGARYGMGSLVF
jgi:hypothetical protein